MVVCGWWSIEAGDGMENLIRKLRKRSLKHLGQHDPTRSSARRAYRDLLKEAQEELEVLKEMMRTKKEEESSEGASSPQAGCMRRCMLLYIHVVIDVPIANFVIDVAIYPCCH